MDVSIVIVNWNTKDILRDCLVSVYEQTDDIEFETIVIDNASSDGSAEMVKSEFSQVVLIGNDENKGFAAANNQGFEIAKGRYVLMLNSDTIVLNEAIQKTVAFADIHGEAAAVGCRILNKDMTLQPSCFMFPSILNLLLSVSYLYKMFPENRFFAREKMGWWERDDIREVDVITGCFILARKEAMDEVGHLDEEYFIYGEETDWCWRFRKAGWVNLFTPDAQIIHLGGASSKSVRGPMLVQLRLSILNFFRKHYSKPVYWLACFLVMLFFALRIPVWFVIGVIKSERRAESKVRTKAYFDGIKKILAGKTDIR